MLINLQSEIKSWNIIEMSKLPTQHVNKNSIWELMICL